MLCPPLDSHIKRAYPFVNISNYMNFTDVEGYIVGVANGVFRNNNWKWDLLCDINTGQVIRAEVPSGQATPISGGNNPMLEGVDVDTSDKNTAHAALDNEFIVEVLAGIDAHFGQDWVRMKFNDYTEKNIIDIAFELGEYLDDETKNKVELANKYRVAKWKRTSSYQNSYVCRSVSAGNLLSIDDANEFTGDRHNFETCESGRSLIRNIRMLQHKNRIESKDIRCKMYEDFLANVQMDPVKLREFVSYLPESQGGLHPIATGLLDEEPSIRENTARLLSSIESVPELKSAVETMNFFFSTAYMRVKRGMESQ